MLEKMEEAQVNEALGSGRVESVARACDILAAFTTASEVLRLKGIAERTHLHKVTAFRILGTLVEKGLVQRIGYHGYRSNLHPISSKRFRIGYAAQSTVVPFTSVVTDSLVQAAFAANVELFVLNNNYSPTVALRNADRFVAESVDLIIESQIAAKVATQITSKFETARIPFIAIDIPHPGSIYFGADNYKAGRLAGLYMGQWITKFWKGTVDQIVLAGVSAAGASLDARLTGFYDGFMKVLPKCRHAQIFHYDTKADFEKTLDVLRKHIRMRPAERVLVGAVNDPTALGALQAFRELGKEDNCTIAGQGAVFEAREEMRRAKSRFVCSVAYFPETYGSQLIRLALDILTSRPAPPAVFVQHQVITPDTVDEIYPNDVLLNSGRPALHT